LRKYAIAALAALMSVTLVAVAMAQGNAATAELTIKPSKAGTKSKPKPISLKLFVKNNVPGTTAKRIDVLLPRNVRATGKGLAKCDKAKLGSQGLSACPAGSKAGSGVANALVNPASPNPAPLRFKVTAFNGGTSSILFYLQQVNPSTNQVIPGGVSRLIEGKLGRASGAAYFQRLRIDIPGDLQQPAPGVYSALQDLETTLKLQKRNNSLLTTIGCKSRKHQLGVVLTYAPNPNPPSVPSSRGQDTTPCSV
jgi:hypothetical protein